MGARRDQPSIRTGWDCLVRHWLPPPGSRVSAADACLAPWLNGDRVVVLSECDVERVRTVGGRTTGVVLGNGTTVACPLVVLAAGVVNTPRLLCQSDLLSSSSLPVMNHPSAMLTFAWPHPSSGRDRQKPQVQRVLRWRSSAEATNTVILIGPLGVGSSPSGALLVMLDRPRSLGVAHIDVGRPTVIEGNHLSDEQDRREMLDGFRHAVGLGAVVTADLGVEPPALSSGGSAQALARASDSAVEAWLRANQGPVFHAVGTCGIAPSSGGVAPITESVAGSLGRVAGTDDLLAVDASVMPGLVAGGLQLPVMAVADKIVSEYLLGKDMV